MSYRELTPKERNAIIRREHSVSPNVVYQYQLQIEVTPNDCKDILTELECDIRVVDVVMAANFGPVKIGM